MVKKMIEGSRAIAEMVGLCRPQVIAAYPITPQTHIVEELSQLVANGELQAEYVNVESEFSAASVILGASATGVRTYTATTSQGLLLMIEVLYNIAGLRLPVVLGCANRAISAPINIWNDQQDSITARDTGWIQLYAESNQEAADLHLQAYRIAEDQRVLLPVMVCLDGYVLTHAYETVDLPSQEEVDAFLPPFRPLYRLDPANPLTFGTLADPSCYMETRYILQRTTGKALAVIEETATAFQKAFGRRSGGLIDCYKTEDAAIILVAMGSVVGTIKEAVDELRAAGQKVGVLKVITHRPFPKEAIYQALHGAEHVIVLEKAISLGNGGPLATEIKATFQERPQRVAISSVIAGLGGRDITVDSIKRAVAMARERVLDGEFLDLRADLEIEEVA
ncbi:MAG: pyruvate ferredoxin oxidoreductase [Chloroflexi bacterium]|nr:pyruvate ferredoxin oxidoreductase [Chloroflexota bacterium]MCL5074891.1 pyruvate ferredoxin oxidoreductase [Chloroflexota bacterium]